MFKKNSSFNVLYTKNISQTHDFYKAINCEIKQLEEDKVVVVIGDFELHFILDITEPFEEYKYISDLTNPGNGVLFYIEVNNINKVASLIEKSGGKVVAHVFDNKWNAKEFLFEDPNGFKIALYQMN